MPVGAASWEVWGTSATVLVAADADVARAREAVERELRRIDRACSRFRRDSDLARVNRAGGRPVAVSATFIEALDAALRAAALTDGAVDPTVGEALRIWGYDRDFALLDQVAERPLRVTRAPRADWRAIAVDASAGTVSVGSAASLDLGATAKALAADRAARAVHLETGRGALVNLGGDIAVAGVAPEDGWRVRVTDDHRGAPAAAGQTVAIRAGGLATSSTTGRVWRRGGARFHHIIDPLTGRPADIVWRTVSVAAGSCVDANTASTTAIVRGAPAAGWLTARAMPARLVSRAGLVQTTCGWPPEAH